jgi:hypothetical protein
VGSSQGKTKIHIFMVSDTTLSRLTIGLMGLDYLHLRVLATSSDDPREKKNAQKGYPTHILVSA